MTSKDASSECPYELDENGNLYDKSLFPHKLRELLDDAEKSGDKAIISWLPHGYGFKVHKPKEFAERIMRKYFKQTQYKSFTRQLYHYGFGKIDFGTDRGAFYHPQFRRDDPSLSLSMERRRRTCQQRIDLQDHYRHEVYQHFGMNRVQSIQPRETSPSPFGALMDQWGGDSLACLSFSRGSTGEHSLPRREQESQTHATRSQSSPDRNINTPVKETNHVIAERDWLSSVEEWLLSSNTNFDLNSTQFEPRSIEEMLRREPLP